MSILSRRGLDTGSWLRSLRVAAPVVVAGLAAIVLAWLIFRIGLPSVDHDVTLAIYNLGGPSGVLDEASRVLWYVASAGDVVWVPLVFWLYVFRKDENEWNSAVILAVALVLAMASTDALKMLFHLPRPFDPSACGTCSSDFVARVGKPTNYAFPSGHTTNSFAVATVMWRRYSAWRLPFLALGVGTGIGMMMVGLHFLSDVIAGAFLGIISGAFATTLGTFRSKSGSVTP